MIYWSDTASIHQKTFIDLCVQLLCTHACSVQVIYVITAGDNRHGAMINTYTGDYTRARTLIITRACACAYVNNVHSSRLIIIVSRTRTPHHLLARVPHSHCAGWLDTPALTI